MLILLTNVRDSLPKQPQTCGAPKSQLMRPSVHCGWIALSYERHSVCCIKKYVTQWREEKKPTEVKRPTLNTLTITPDNTHTTERLTTKNLFYLTYFFTIKNKVCASNIKYIQTVRASEWVSARARLLVQFWFVLTLRVFFQLFSLILASFFFSSSHFECVSIVGRNEISLSCCKMRLYAFMFGTFTCPVLRYVQLLDVK